MRNSTLRCVDACSCVRCHGMSQMLHTIEIHARWPGSRGPSGVSREQLHILTPYNNCLRLALLAVNTFPRSKKLSGVTRESFDKHNLCLYYQLNSRTNEQTRRGGQKGEFPASLPRRCTCKACIRSVPVPWGLMSASESQACIRPAP